MPLRHYSANATLSNISTTSFNQPPKMSNNNKAKPTMKENKKNPVDDTQPNAKMEQTTSASAQSNKAKVPVSKLSLVAIALTVCLAGAMGYYGYDQLKEQKKTISALKAQLANYKQNTKESILNDLQNTLTTAQNTQNQKITSLEQRVDRKLNEQQQTQQLLVNQVNDSTKLYEQSFHNLNERLAAMSTTDHHVWLISQANYLVHLAGRKIWNDQDYTSARLLLKSADESLAQIDDSNLLPARQAITNDINALSHVSFIDTDGIILNLLSLSESITDLPLVGNNTQDDKGKTESTQEPQQSATGENMTELQSVTQSADQTSEDNQVSSSVKDWSNNLTSNAASFMSKFITIEKIDSTENNFATCLDKADGDEKKIVKCQILQTPLTLDQSLNLRENIRFRLLIAAQAVPRHQDVIYQRALNDTATWVNAYFDSNASSVKAFTDSLTKLQNQSISNQDVPNQLTSISELEKLMQTRVRAMLSK